MAIYHFSHRKNKRSSGANVKNKVAYRIRSNVVFKDFNTGQMTKRYHYPKDGEIVLDLGVYGDLPPELQDPMQWAEAIEKAENRRNSVVCREFEVALPRELSLEEMKQAVKDLIDKTITKHGLSAHAAIHIDKDGNNPHAHILFTERVFDNKKNKFGKKSRVYTSLGSETLELARAYWEDSANKYLEKHNIKISAKSHKDRNIREIEPTKKIGHQKGEKRVDNILHNIKQNTKRDRLIKENKLFSKKYFNIGISEKVKRAFDIIKNSWKKNPDIKRDEEVRVAISYTENEDLPGSPQKPSEGVSATNRRGRKPQAP